MHLILFGFKSCGKTFFGSRLAKQHSLLFIDTDALMAPPESIRELYLQLGEARFRALEASVIRSLNPHSRAIISLGGGSVLNPVSLNYLQTIGRLVYLEASLETIRQRILDQRIESLEALYEQRKAVYEIIPAHRINTDQLMQVEVLASLSALLKEVNRGI